MSDYYYCSECGDGPHNTTYSPTCPNCFHSQNNSHQAINVGYYAYRPDSYETTSYANTETNTMDGAYLSDASSATACLTGNSTPYNQCPKQPPNWYWVCCKCGDGGGSVANDKGCATCCNHWRCSGCGVYDASKKQ